MSSSTIAKTHIGTPAMEIPAKRRIRKSAPAWSSKTAVNIMLVLFCLYTLLPLTWLLVAATKDTSDLFSTPGFSFAENNFFANLTELFTWENGTYLRWLLNTVGYAVFGSVCSVFVSFLAGYAFDKFDFPGKERWFGFILVGVLVPAAVTTMPLYLLAANVGLVNTFWGVFLPSIASPFGVYLARVFATDMCPRNSSKQLAWTGPGKCASSQPSLHPL